ncbi:MAG: undecaprenyl-diphosphatase UppP [Kofleriaceae bacterium]|nr:undecaprenyl-diphosphatase UppP [Myxococcales bacterium]MCB9560521.1 undecaprenyl-diphosphatase UppP [Kofleriaceae bacterium]
MSLWFAVVLGLVEGLTEFIPISSTAHLRITPTLLGQPDPGAAFAAVIQLGPLVAVCAYFAKDLFVTLPRAMIKAPRSPEGRLPWMIAVGTIPVVAAGLLLKHQIEGDFRSLYVVAGALVGVGLLMAYIDARGAGQRGTFDLGWTDAILIGMAQACALVPGVSRSGATICMALVLGMSRKESARFSFLLGIPAIAGAGVFELREIHLGGDALMPVIVGTLVAAVSGYLSIAWLLKFLGTHRLRSFAVYRVIAGLVLLALLASHVIAATAGQ